MNTNCEKMCKRCIDHIDFWTKPDAGGNITHVAGKKALARLRKMDEQMVTMWHHSNLALCKGCVYARPFFAAAAAAGKAKFPDVTVWAAIDCSKTEKTCSKMKFKSEVRVPRPLSPAPGALSHSPTCRRGCPGVVPDGSVSLWQDGQLPVFKFFGDAEHWKTESQGVDIGPRGLMGPDFPGIAQAVRRQPLPRLARTRDGMSSASPCLLRSSLR